MIGIDNIFTKDNPLILASGSPQRVNILKTLNIPFEAIPSEVEEVLSENYSQMAPEQVAMELALQKALDVQKRHGDKVILGVDTLVVSSDGKILGKPSSREEARIMTLNKSGQKETVISGIALLYGNRKIIEFEKTEVFFAEIFEDEVEKILGFNEWQDRSGAFSIEGKSVFFIKKIDGDFWNVVGLPVYLFGKMMNSIKN